LKAMPHRLAALTLLIAEYDEAIAWFTRSLGFALICDIALGAGKRWVVVSPGEGGAQIVLAQPGDERQRARIGDQAGGRVMMFLHTDNFARDHEAMQARGVRFLEEPRSEPYGTVAVFEDAWGNRWDLIEPLKG
jgi:catechol 2,3-dioxygenase-like lactoylglutathione lyase family enzyme